PITAILGMNEMIRREAKEPAILEYSENIRKAGVSLLGIISDILDFSKIETGRLELELEEYSLASLVADLYNLVHFRAEEKGLELVIRIAPDLPERLMGDTVRIKQIITNLLTNAVKYTEKGSVTFEMKPVKKSGDRVCIGVSVTDTGIGIRKEDTGKLFEPFDRLDLKKTRSIEGSGLGLAITRQLLSVMNSELIVESRYGEGSRFYFDLWQSIVDAAPVGEIDPAELLHESVPDTKREAHFTAPGMRILLVDDTPMNLQVIAGLLKRTMMKIDVAESGAGCIEKFGANDYDLVFLDYRMPQLNGIETLEMLRERFPDKFRKTPVISLTASAVSGDRERMLAAGFTDYLPKPVDIGEMERMMLKYLPEDAIVIKESDPASEAGEKTCPELPHYPGLDTEKGIEYCGDEEDYIFALKTFAASVREKAAELEEALSLKDKEAFVLRIHSLKSTSQAIGASLLSGKALALEEAAREDDAERLLREMPSFLKEYRELGAFLEDALRNLEEGTAG
ncbi:MAG TPA: hybrid sensor histidine kinase/response regulator, partial [Lachnospiraceae bacterium]|nr:hybrid sensor histidine kinase/response regulator [Lachnospiraceae bacterium]